MQQPVSVSPTELVEGFKWFRDNAGLGWTTFAMGVAVFSAGGVWFYFKRYRPLKHAPHGGDTPAVIPNTPVIVSGFRFYPSRDALSQGLTLKQQIESADEIWALWHAGSHVSNQGVLKTGRVKRILLSDPSGPSFNSFCSAIGKQPQHIRNDIERLTTEATNLGVPVRWWVGHISNTLMIGNPDSINGWLHFETLFPNVEAGERPSFRIGRQEFSSLFQHLKKAYEQMWDASVQPRRM
ncbi:MAG TPA: hypothetical protein VGJ78_23910 [Vicinamibacterales bacterium]